MRDFLPIRYDCPRPAQRGGHYNMDVPTGHSPRAIDCRNLELFVRPVNRVTCNAALVYPLNPRTSDGTSAGTVNLSSSITACFHLYHLTREDVQYILGTFQGIVDEDQKAGGEGNTRHLVLEAFDRICST